MLSHLWLHMWPLVAGRGLLLLYRPKDISNDCVFSHQLRYDVSFGMGMADTITLVLRNLKETDYECTVEIVTDSTNTFLIVVIHFPNSIEMNCAVNKEAFTVLKKNKCLAICDLVGDRVTHSPYFIISVRGRIRFRFLSNSSINTDMEANVYQVTATSARIQPKEGCNAKNETICNIDRDRYCFTSGVVCDGIKNCGVTDWYDERKSECELPQERIGYAPVVAVVAVLLCVLLAASHMMMRVLPLSANSYFIFNANEDNRLCIDSVFKAPDHLPDDVEKIRKLSLIPVSSTSSEEKVSHDDITGISMEMQRLNIMEPPDRPDVPEPNEEPPEEVDPVVVNKKERKTTMRTMTEMLQNRLRSVTSRRRNAKIYLHDLY